MHTWQCAHIFDLIIINAGRDSQADLKCDKQCTEEIWGQIEVLHRILYWSFIPE